jgi:hypothetical protein
VIAGDAANVDLGAARSHQRGERFEQAAGGILPVEIGGGEGHGGRGECHGRARGFFTSPRMTIFRLQVEES